MTADRISKLQRLLEEEPGDAFTLYALALEYSGQGDPGQAVLLLERLRTEQPDYIASYHQLGILYEGMGKTDKATEIYAQGIAIARRLGDGHAAREMQDALDLLS